MSILDLDLDGITNEDAEAGLRPRTVGATRRLTAEQEVELARRIEAGDESAREEFILANQRLVWHVASWFNGRGLDFDDLCQEGNIGLMHAV